MTLRNTCVFCSTCLMMIIKLEQTFKRRKIIYSRINTRENYYEQRITCLFAANILQWKKRFVNFEFKCFFYPLGIVSTGFYLLVLYNTVVLFWGVNWFHTLNGFLNMENVTILPYKVPKYQNNSFLGHFRLLHGYNLIAYLH